MSAPRIVEATRAGSSCRRFFVESANSMPGGWWRVDLIPGESLTCTCPFGRRIAGQPVTPAMKLCRHLRAVAQRLLDERQAVA